MMSTRNLVAADLRSGDTGFGRPPSTPAGEELAADDRHEPAAAATGTSFELVAVAAVREIRTGDTGFGRPLTTLVGQDLTPEDEEARSKGIERQEEDKRRRFEQDLASRETLLPVPTFLRGPLVICTLVAVSAALGLFLLGQIASTMASLRELPAWGQWLAGAFLALLVLAVLLAAGRLAHLYFRLRPNRPFPLRGIQELAQHAQLQRLVRQEKGKAYEVLCRYLETHRRDIATRGTQTYSTVSAADLSRVCNDLLNRNQLAGYDRWFDEFRRRFQGPLDMEARARITHYARRVGVVTAASPNALVDTLVVGYCAFTMLGDLCSIYNVRPGRLGTAVLLTRVFFNAYVAGGLNEVEGYTDAGIREFMAETGISAVVGGVTTKALGKFGSRALSGTLNYFMMQRLGRLAIRQLRPVSEE